ncbi:hypothetical protein ACFX1Z_024417 [Malus domestica]
MFIDGYGVDSWIFSVAYGSPNISKRQCLWKTLDLIYDNSTLPWLVAGDFNCVLFADERYEGNPISFVKHLPKLSSDHNPLLISLMSNKVPRATLKPFGFEAMWLQPESFKQHVQANWSTSNHNIPFKLNEFKEVLEKWNWEIFGNIFHKQKRIFAQLQGIQKALDVKHSQFLLDLEDKLLQDYYFILNQEACF